MSWLTSLFSSGASQVVDSVGSAIDRLVTSDSEKLELRNALVEIKQQAILKAEDQALQADKEITKRWDSDNEHFITRLVRPLIVLWSFGLLTVVMLFDGNIAGFAIKAAYIPLLETIVTTSVVAYMGMRTLDKYNRKNK